MKKKSAGRERGKGTLIENTVRRGESTRESSETLHEDFLSIWGMRDSLSFARRGFYNIEEKKDSLPPSSTSRVLYRRAALSLSPSKKGRGNADDLSIPGRKKSAVP